MQRISGSRLSSLIRGFRGRCPRCGSGRLFYSYLKPIENCAVCGEALGKIRTDDVAPWLTILCVGHLVVPMILISEHLGMAPNIQVALWVPIVLLLTLLLLPRCKGLIIGLMWSLELSGSGAS